MIICLQSTSKLSGTVAGLGLILSPVRFDRLLSALVWSGVAVNRVPTSSAPVDRDPGNHIDVSCQRFQLPLEVPRNPGYRMPGSVQEPGSFIRDR